MTDQPASGTPPIYVFEEHGSTLPVWWQHRGTPRTVVYLDAHLDLQRIDTQLITTLRKCKTLDEFKTHEVPRPASQNLNGVYGIENFLYPAAQLGLIDRLVWVVPPHIPRSYTQSLATYIQQMDGVTFEELTGFHQVNPDAARGKLLGLDITLCHYTGLNDLNLDPDYDLDVDIDYFVRVPEDKLWTDPQRVVQSVIETLGVPRITTISRAVSSGFTPLKHRFIADQIEAVISGNSGRSEYFHLVAAATMAAEQGNGDRACALCDQAIASHPDQPAAYYAKSVAMLDSVSVGGEDAETLASQAHDRDNRYVGSLLEQCTGITARKQLLDKGRIERLQAEMEAMQPDEAERSAVEVAIAELLAKTGQVGKSWQLLNRRKRPLEEQADALLLIGTALAGSGQSENAWRALDMARQVDQTRTVAGYQLGQIAHRAGKFDVALKFYNDVHQRTPAWLAPVEQMLDCLQRLGRDSEAKPIAAELARRQGILDELTAGSNF